MTVRPFDPSSRADHGLPPGRRRTGDPARLGMPYTARTPRTGHAAPFRTRPAPGGTAAAEAPVRRPRAACPAMPSGGVRFDAAVQGHYGHDDLLLFSGFSGYKSKNCVIWLRSAVLLPVSGLVAVRRPHGPAGVDILTGGVAVVNVSEPCAGGPASGLPGDRGASMPYLACGIRLHSWSH